MSEFEVGLHRFIEDKYPELLEKLRTEKKLTDEIKELLDKAIGEFKAGFHAGS